MNAYVGTKIYLHSLLTSVLAGGGQSALHPGRFNPMERAPSTYYTGSLVGGASDPDCIFVNANKGFSLDTCRHITVLIKFGQQ
jgi:hypothetical protein